MAGSPGGHAGARRLTSIRQPSEKNAGEQDNSHHAPVDGKGPGRKSFENPQQAPNRGKGRQRCDDEPETEDRPAMRVEMRLMQFPNFFSPRAGDRRQPKQKRKAGRFLAFEVSEESGGERRAGS